MGMLTILTQGSFPYSKTTFAAQGSGHAVAVDDAIKFLEGERDKAVKLDESLRDRGHGPDDGFNEAAKRGLVAKEAKAN